MEKYETGKRFRWWCGALFEARIKGTDVIQIRQSNRNRTLVELQWKDAGTVKQAVIWALGGSPYGIVDEEDNKIAYLRGPFRAKFHLYSAGQRRRIQESRRTTRRVLKHLGVWKREYDR